MTIGKGWIFIGLACLTMGFVSCGGKNTQGAGGAVTGDGAINTKGFLETDFEPLNKWFDEDRFSVDYKHMTLELIFDQVPLNQINYHTENLPENPAPFNYSHNAISRRELLKVTSEHWKLKMSLVEDDSGTPVAVMVKGR